MQKRDSLALVLGLSKARVIDVHRGAASRLYLDFLQGKLQQKWTLDAVDVASLKVSTVHTTGLEARVVFGFRRVFGCVFVATLSKIVPKLRKPILTPPLPNIWAHFWLLCSQARSHLLA